MQVLHAPPDNPDNEFRRIRNTFLCRCGKPVFFRNSQCLACKAPLGYDPELATIAALEAAGDPETWRFAAGGENPTLYHRCANLTSVSGCNWLVEATDGKTRDDALCLCCRLDRTIPDLSVPANVENFRRVGIAKRRLISLLASLRLPLASRLDEDPEHGLAFDVLRSADGGPSVMTGHSDGIITLNLDEADDATRERIRNQMGEPYRTILGHLRHEVGHYYWDRLISGTPWIEDFRKLFGDERRDYAQALQKYYQNGPALDWQRLFVSAYASSHPWEDWAECWAHYLHIADTFATVRSFGLDPDTSLDIEIEPFNVDSLYDGGHSDASGFLHFINSWIRLTAPLNEMSRAMGLADFYPFVLSRSAVAKLHFVHVVIAEAGAGKGRGDLLQILHRPAEGA